MEGFVLRILYREIRHIKVHLLINLNYSFILNNWNFFLDSSILIISKSYYLFACCPEKPFGFGCSLPLENDLDFAKE